MELFYLLAVPVVTSLLAPIVLKFITEAYNKRKTRQEARLTLEQHDDQVAADLRNELRAEIVRKDRIINELEEQALSQYELTRQKDKWEQGYYAMKKEKERINFELVMVKKELETVKEQYEQYHRIREHIERQSEDS